jgi:hypothetical protein
LHNNRKLAGLTVTRKFDLGAWVDLGRSSRDGRRAVAAGGQAAVNSGAQRQDGGDSPEARRRHSKSISWPRNLTKLTRKRSKGARELTQGLVEAGELAEKEIGRAELRRVAALRLGMLLRRERAGHGGDLEAGSGGLL